MPRLRADMSLSELSAFARLRGALFMDLHERLPNAMKKRAASAGSSGDLRAAIRSELKSAEEGGFTGEDALVVAVAAMLMKEADEVRSALAAEVKREFEQATKMENAMGFIVAQGVPPVEEAPEPCDTPAHADDRDG